MAIPADLSNPGEVQRVTEKILLEFGKVDILVNDFNSEFGKPVLETDEEEWIRVMDANLKTVLLCSKIVGRHMVERESGRIINIVTGAAERGAAQQYGPLRRYGRRCPVHSGPGAGMGLAQYRGQRCGCGLDGGKRQNRKRKTPSGAISPWDVAPEEKT